MYMGKEILKDPFNLIFPHKTNHESLEILGELRKIGENNIIL